MIVTGESDVMVPVVPSVWSPPMTILVVFGKTTYVVETFEGVTCANVSEIDGLSTDEIAAAVKATSSLAGFAAYLSKQLSSLCVCFEEDKAIGIVDDSSTKSVYAWSDVLAIFCKNKISPFNLAYGASCLAEDIFVYDPARSANFLLFRKGLPTPSYGLLYFSNAVDFQNRAIFTFSAGTGDVHHEIGTAAVELPNVSHRGTSTFSICISLSSTDSLTLTPVQPPNLLSPCLPPLPSHFHTPPSP